MNNITPTLEEFLTYCRESMKFLDDFGFKEITIPPHRNNNPFQLWYKSDKRNVIIIGEGWGTSATIYLEHDDGFELAEIYLVPQDKRPKRQKTRKNNPSQLEQVSQAAKWLKEYGVDFLEGNLERFFMYARPLPPYKLPY